MSVDGATREAHGTSRSLQRLPFREQLPEPSLEYRSAIGKWLARGEPIDDHAGATAGIYPGRKSSG
jgi:hypothetical protein